jgi:CheY-like chemotaxis protein
VDDGGVTGDPATGPRVEEAGSALAPPGGNDVLYDLMPAQVREILFVSSPYESFIMAEDGQLAELVLSEFLDLNLSYPPKLTHISSGAEAVTLLRRRPPYDLLVTSLHTGDVTAPKLARAVRDEGLDIPVVLLAYDNAALKEFLARHDASGIERIFLWQGDVRLLLAIVKTIEDRRNAPHDTKLGVPVFIVVEDNIHYYSSFLPTVYAEVMKHSQAVVSEGLNLTQKLLRLRARPKILLATTFEEAWQDFTTYGEQVLGVITDIEFPRNGELSPTAGIDLARRIREARPDVGLTLQSSIPENRRLADSIGARFLLKGSPVMLQQLREQLSEYFFFGDFVFRLPDGSEVDRARDLRSLLQKLETVPEESIAYHAARNDFSNWLRARAEFELARKLRPRRISDYASIEALRRDVIHSIDESRRERTRTTVADFDSSTFETGGIARIGGGSLGGKARGLAFASRLLEHSRIAQRFPGVRVTVPTNVVLGTDVFEEFLEDNRLREVALRSDDEAQIEDAFAAAFFPDAARDALAAFLERMRRPLAVRSSSRLEDSPNQPFAGVFETRMLPNDHPDAVVRVERLISAVKRVYASTFSRRARAILSGTPLRLEEEQMAVIVQELVGSRHGRMFYPDFAGVARSHNFYPTSPLATEDGIVAVALGFGRTVMEGEPCVRFSPAYPHHIVEFSSATDMLRNAQRHFWALVMGDEAAGDWEEPKDLVRCALGVAESNGVLAALASTFSPENDAVYDGVGRAGIRLVSFAPILKHGVFPLADLLRELLALGVRGTGTPVEIEFAVNLGDHDIGPAHLGFLQLRPLTGASEVDDLEIDAIPDGELICRSPAVLGNGTVDGVRDLIVLDPRAFDRGHTGAAARAVARFNAELTASGEPYLLLGVGRWGSRDPWLGIPVDWPEIAGARAIVEVGFHDFKVVPSQGTHFFQNLVSATVGYFTVNAEAGQGFVDWDWLAAQPAAAERDHVRHLRLQEPVTVIMNGRTRQGVIRKPRIVPAAAAVDG